MEAKTEINLIDAVPVSDLIKLLATMPDGATVRGWRCNLHITWGE